jgi:hypothetical protein
LRHLQTFGRAAEVELLGDCDEVAQVAQLGHQVSVLRGDTRPVPLETDSVFPTLGGRT